MYSRTIFQSFKLAIGGLIFVITSERNMKIHLLFAFCALIASYVLKINHIEFVFVVFSIALVLITEAANTAFELLLDYVHGDRYHPDVKLLKDIAAGGVFVAALNAFVIGCVIFVPKIGHTFNILIGK
jgi:diacylglycerol kinase (ATP)